MITLDPAAIDSISWNIAHRLADMHENGRAQLKRGGKSVARANARANAGKRHTLTTYQGTGVRLSTDDRNELYLSARAAFVARLMQGDSVQVAWIAGARAARRELYMVTREPVFDSREKAEAAHERAQAFTQAQLDEQSDAPAKLESATLDFLTIGDSSIDPRRLLLPFYWRARKACRAWWNERKALKPYPRLQSDMERDLASLRGYARQLISGTVPARTLKRDDEAAYKRFREFSSRMEAAHDLFFQPTPPPNVVPTPTVQAQTRTIELPIGRVENWERDYALGQIPVAKRILDRIPATHEELKELAAMFN